MTSHRNLTQFFKEFAKHKKSILLLDYDGTIAPFKKNREQALIHPQIKKELEKLLRSKNTTVIIISGRKITNLLPLLHLNPLPEIWGSHGMEKRLKSGKIIKEKISKRQKKGLKLAAQICKNLVPHEYYEIKLFSVACHLRGMKNKQKLKILKPLTKAWKKLEMPYNLELINFQKGREIRAFGKNKGSAVESILSSISSNYLVAYLGDDITDEEAFKALGKRGLKILVGYKRGKTYADVRIKTMQGVAHFLKKWQRVSKKGK